MNRCLATLLLIFTTCALKAQVVDFSKLPLLQGETLKDNKGAAINAHGAGILFHNGVYYLYGEIKKGKTWLVPGQSWEDYRVPAGGISCYSSRDLVSWKYEGIALAPSTGNGSSDIDTGRVIERPKVIYNAVTKQFVMWMHIDTRDYAFARAGVAVSNSPTGPFVYRGSIRPNGQMARDMTVFKDDDGKAYLIYSSENNATMQVCLLSTDYLSPTTRYSRILVNRSREAPAMFKYGKKYFLITSACTGWSPNQATYAVAERPLGPWKEFGNPCRGTDADKTFYAQSTYVLPVDAAKGQYLFLADKWNKLDLERSTYTWLPLQMTADGPVIPAKLRASAPLR
ncbi:MAG: family 43 glycosylhydrolase [Chitinophagaceae bacterium]|nr:family 43 glycosylhydrolase [Chitinophagaceae bacterium]